MAGGAVVAVLLVVAIAKPWSWGADDASRVPIVRAHPSPTPAAPAPTPDLSAAGLASAICLGTGAWRVASLETWQLMGRAGVATQQVRVWTAVTPTAASSPTDGSIAVIHVAAMQVDALGWCAPVAGPDAPIGPAQVQAFRLDPSGRAFRITLRRIAPLEGDTPFAALYQAGGDCMSDIARDCGAVGQPLAGARWPPGRYVFRVSDAGANRILWFGVEVVEVPGPSGLPSVPSTQPEAAGPSSRPH